MRRHISINFAGGWLIWLSAGVLTAVILTLLKIDLIEVVGTARSSDGITNRAVSASVGYLVYLFFCRGFPYYILVLITIRTRRKIFSGFYLWYGGFSYGIQAILLNLQHGLSGILICFIQMMPQLLLYLPAFYLIYHIAEKSGFQGGIPSARGQSGIIVTAILLWSAGILCEWHLNARFMDFIMEFFNNSI